MPDRLTLAMRASHVLTVLFVLLHFWKKILLAVAPYLGEFGRSLQARFGKAETGH